MGGHRRDVYFHDIHRGEQRHHRWPSRRRNLGHPGLWRFRLWDDASDIELEPDALAFNVLELPDGLLGDIDGTLDVASRKVNQQRFFPEKRWQMGTEEDVHRRSPPWQRTPTARHRNRR
jgi:hypothetical protein